MTAVLSPSGSWSKLESGNAYSQGILGGLPRFQSTQSAGQAHNFKFSNPFPSAQTSNHDQTFPGPRLGPSDPATSIDRYTRKLVPRGAKMRVVETGPTQSDCQIQFLDPSTNFLLSNLTVDLRRDKKQSDDALPNASAVQSYGMKASGVLCRSDGVPLKVTVSGWSQFSELDHQLDNTEWTEKSLKMCAEIEHKLEGFPRMDHGIDGKYEASHIEKQFLAYVYSKVNAVGHNALRPPFVHDEQRMDWEQTFEDVFVERRVVIYVDRPRVCKDCMACATIFTKRTGIQITLYVNGQLWMD